MNILGPGLGFLPISLGVLATATFVSTYIISVVRNDVEVFFPYISDTGTNAPESCIFGQFLNLSAFLSLATMYVRYKLVKGFISDEYRGIDILNKVAAGFGILTSLGLSMVANFQETKVEVVHFLGAGLVFGGGVVYSLLHCAISYKMYPQFNGVYICRWRLALSLFSLISMVVTFIAASISRVEWNAMPDHPDSRVHWKPTDWGYAPHVVSTIAEWCMSIAFLLYFFTYIRDFQKVDLGIVVHLQVSHLDEEPVNIRRSPDETTQLLI
ncbi:DNA damage-regulated autophagy modulator protein 1 [Lingula anatina]|uniref:DNA damage-regulated autophagy modulator protein 1 n=1 Tax=Lingula anatina TaxID=7574 RepID=A0A1S3HF33_LINAN|nr:DNA damage-regulated autophagy modulator protein 1 [Lingula anatina]XP_013384683.1 DNA damage-regulated autophagy modulator protein 1 [Lingula anatina]XP_013384684.1 DNA damage-regulated autophagy modulator protein 1 [Lingula anatina]XP_013384686.1 DNA damage-regulated autophagy modulator protein 1 [Lingula anatina]|eukprot:XP_013384682.1 DNA damage-regulated autophagy modulator protein 1 [Lingula anatina]